MVFDIKLNIHQIVRINFTLNIYLNNVHKDNIAFMGIQWFLTLHWLFTYTMFMYTTPHPQSFYWDFISVGMFRFDIIPWTLQINVDSMYFKHWFAKLEVCDVVQVECKWCNGLNRDNLKHKLYTTHNPWEEAPLPSL